MTALFGQRLPKRAAWLALWWLFGLWCLFKPAGRVPVPFLHDDKLGHFALFAVQAALLYLAAAGRCSAWVWAGLAVWARLSEVLRATPTHDRSGDPFDALVMLMAYRRGRSRVRGAV
jgi:hypothetical protein